MLLRLLLMQPPTLLPICRHLVREPTGPDGEPKHVRDAERCGHGKGRPRDRVERDDGHQAERDPGSLGHEGATKLEGRLFDLVEAGVFAIGKDALEEI